MNTAPDLSGTDPPAQGLASWYMPGLTDGFGDRLLMFDNTDADGLEMLRFHSGLVGTPGFEEALRERVRQIGQLPNGAFPPVRALKRLESDGSLVLVSTYSPGKRLSAFVTAPRPGKEVHPAFVTWVVGQVMQALAMLQSEGDGFAHGAITADRIVLSPDGRVRVAEHVLGSALRHLNRSSSGLWREFGVLSIPSANTPRLDAQSDVFQVGALALSMLLGRRLSADDAEQRLPQLLDQWSSAVKPPYRVHGDPLRIWLERALQLNDRPYRSAADAYGDLRRLPAAARNLELVHGGDAMFPRAVLPSHTQAGSEGSDEAQLSGAVWTSEEPVSDAVDFSTPVATAPVVAAPIAAPPVVVAAPVVPAPIAATPLVSDPLVSDPVVAAPAVLEPVVAAPIAADQAVVVPAVVDPPVVVPPVAAPPVSAPAVAAPLAAASVATPPSAVVPAAVVPAVAPAVPDLILPERSDANPLGLSGSKYGGPLTSFDLEPEGASRMPTMPSIVTRLMSAPGASKVWSSVVVALVAAVVVEGAVIATLFVRESPEPAASAVVAAPVAEVNQNPIAEPASTALASAAPAIAQSPSAPVANTPAAAAPAANRGAGGLDAAIAAAESRQRSGGVRLTTPIELKVLQGDRVLGSSSDGPIVTSEGTHQLDFINTALGFRARQSVTFRAGEIRALTVPVPPGRVSVNADPWAEVWIGARLVGETPLANLEVPIGEHEIVFRHPELGERRQNIVVRADAITRVSATFARQ